ncbi:cell filamentation protein, partial [Sphingobium xenophagum]
RSVRPISAKHAQASRFLQQSPPALDRLAALADGIGRELAQQRSAPSPSIIPMRPNGRDDIER